MMGQDVSANCAQVRDDWSATVLAFLAHSAKTPVHLAAVLQRDPGFALAHAVKGLFCLMLGRREMVAVAQEALVAAQAAALARPVPRREAAFIAALAEWLNGSPRGAIVQMETVLARHPDDALAVKIGHGIRFMLGDSTGMRASLERVLPAYAPGHAARGYLLGCHAFALEETGDYAAAEAAGRAGLELAPDDAWGLHAVAHVYDMTGDARGGIGWLTGREQAWAHCNNFRYHVWWHKALLHLDLGQTDVVLDLYDTQIRADRTDDYRDISNATSLLSRLELEGVKVGARWEELADICEKRTEDGCLIFADLHYLLALVGGQRDTAITRMMGRMQRTAAEGQTEMAGIAAHPGLAAATGLEAFGEGDFGRAYLHLARARRALPGIGGSHAQRDVFERLTIDAAIRAGYHEDAQTLLAERTALRAGRRDGYAEARHALLSRAEDAARQAAQ
ncbi:tetratricopeptide repeat protein [Fertoebacter nigrum]|uniref:Tetratricopeptide repeat protein 38 n=2 Tax=Fertoeibacter niger TaxID=2656921 RepID=A0A8X8GZE1_9RHOB|nr:tetratricopeptide repeat protein [Fertoeibacter niger]NUB43292.1 tetratricopeptide repeat protein [Fertoeibacter niger]